MNPRRSAPVSRREWLKQAAVTSGSLAVGLGWRPSAAQGAPEWRATVAAYLETLAKEDGGYGFADQVRSHLTVTWAVLGSYRILDLPAPRRDVLAALVPEIHPHRGRKPGRPLHEFLRQQIESLVWLKADASGLRRAVLGITQPLEYARRYEQNGNPVIEQEVAIVLSRQLLGLPLDDVRAPFTEYLAARRRPSGAYNYTLANDGSDGHVLATERALATLQALGQLPPESAKLVAWLRDCQLAGGGFTYQPIPRIAGIDDVRYTEAAVRALAILGAKPSDAGGCATYLRSLANDDGGFGDRPGWRSSPQATYYALSALATLGAVEQSLVESRSPAVPSVSVPPIAEDLKVWTIQLEAHGRGSCYEAVDLAEALRIHLWGAKNAQPGWIERAQKLADARKTQVTFCVADEEYGTFVSLPGLGTYSHTSDLFAPAGVDIGESLARNSPLEWEAFRQKRLPPLERAGGRLFWQFGENESFTRVLLDDSLARGGFAAISTYHFGNPDFITSQPFLYRYRHHLPFVAIHDAHGEEPWWWTDKLTGYRTVFLAKDPTWDAWLTALKNNWVMAIRRDAVTDYELLMHGGADGVRERVLSQIDRWQWWHDDAPGDRRPLVSIVPLVAGEPFEVGAPNSGMAVRIRCASTNTAQGLPKQPLVDLVSVDFDGRTLLAGEQLKSSLVQRYGARRSLSDVYHLIALPNLPTGQHRLTAWVKLRGHGRMATREVSFTV